jgi:hypothetical protein
MESQREDICETLTLAVAFATITTASCCTWRTSPSNFMMRFTEFLGIDKSLQPGASSTADFSTRCLFTMLRLW